MKKFLSLIAAVLVLATCMTVMVSAADKLLITSATSDAKAAAEKAQPSAAVDNLRQPDGLWYMGRTDDTGLEEDSIAGERYLLLALDKVSKVDELKVMWFQGNGPAPEYAPTADKNRTYNFYITVSKDGKEWDQAWPKQGAMAQSGTGADFETYPINMDEVGYIRIHSTGSTGDSQPNNNAFIAIRKVEAYGTAGTEAVTQVQQKPAAGGSTSGSSPSTGDFENLVIFGTVAVLSCAAVVVIRKKIRER